MEWLHLLMPLEKYQRNIVLQGNTEYCLLHVHEKYLTERKEKKLMIRHEKKKQYYKAMEPAEKKNIIGEKTIQEYEK